MWLKLTSYIANFMNFGSEKSLQLLHQIIFKFMSIQEMYIHEILTILKKHFCFDLTPRGQRPCWILIENVTEFWKPVTKLLF